MTCKMTKRSTQYPFKSQTHHDNFLDGFGWFSANLPSFPGCGWRKMQNTFYISGETMISCEINPVNQPLTMTKRGLWTSNCCRFPICCTDMGTVFTLWRLPELPCQLIHSCQQTNWLWIGLKHQKLGNLDLSHCSSICFIISHYAWWISILFPL